MEYPLANPEQFYRPFTGGGFLTKTIVISLLLHAVFAFLLLSGDKRVDKGGVNFLDLNMSYTLKSTPPSYQETATTEDEAPPALPQEPPPPLSASDKMATEMQQAIDTAKPEAALESVGRFSLGLGMTRGYFQSLANGNSLREDIKEYYFILMQNINARWWIGQKQLGKNVNAVVVNIIINRNGEIVVKEILQSSGNVVYDQEVLNALGGVGPLPPLPDSYKGTFFEAPFRLIPPLNLLAS